MVRIDAVGICKHHRGIDILKRDKTNMKYILIDMYGVIIEESKGYFIPYTYEHFEQSEYDRITKVFREEKMFTKAQLGLCICH